MTRPRHLNLTRSAWEFRYKSQLSPKFGRQGSVGHEPVT